MSSLAHVQSLTVRAFGYLRIERSRSFSDESPRFSKAQVHLLAGLVAGGPAGLSHDRLAEVVWPKGPPRTWQPALRLNISRLRAQAPGLEIVAEAGRYRLHLPVEAVDTWWLDSLIRNSTPPTSDDIDRALAGQPFDEVYGGPLLDDARHAAESNQRQLVERFGALGLVSIPDSTATTLLSFGTLHHHDTSLCEQVIGTLRAAGRSSEADRLHQLAAKRNNAATDASLRPAERRVRQTRRHPALDTNRTGPLAGRDSIIAELVAPSTSVVLGTRGSGRTRLVAAAVDTLEAGGCDYVYIAALGAHAAAFAALHAALPMLAEVETPATNDLEESIAAVRAHWKFLVADAEAGVKPVHYFIDDAHDLDSQSLEVIRLLAHTSLSQASLGVNLIADEDDASTPWLTLLHDLQRASVTPIRLGPLDHGDVANMVRHAFPFAVTDAASQLADDILATSGGIAAVVVSLIDATDPETLTLPDRVAPGHETSRLLTRLDDDVRSVAVAAAVLGTEFHLGMLVELLQLPAMQVERAISELWDRELIDETDRDPDVMAFRDVRLCHALVASVPSFRLRALHARAAEIESDLHARAEHAYQAAPTQLAVTTVSLLAESAAEHFGSRNWRAAARQYERLSEALGDGMAVDQLTSWASALDASGLDGSQARTRAFERSIAERAWASAVDAALSGLPGAERTNGDPIRLAQLRRLPFDEVPKSKRFEVAYYLSRFAAHNAELEAADEWAASSLELAGDPTEVATAHIALWTARHHTRPGNHTFPSSARSISGIVGARVHEMTAIAAFEANDIDAAEHHHRLSIEHAEAANDPARLWHGLCFGAVLARRRGRYSEAEELADRGYEHATLHGYPEAMSARAAPIFTDAYDRNQLDELVPLMASVRNDIARSTVGASAVAYVDAMVGDRDRGHREAARIVRAAIDQPESMSRPIVAMLTPVVAQIGDSELGERCRSFLLPFGSTSFVTGFGITAHGPTWRYLAELAESEAERTDWLTRSIEVADTSGGLHWRVLSRIHLADHLDDEALRTEARLLAEGTEVATLFD